MGLTQTEQQKEKKKKNLSEDKLRDLWDNIKQNIFIYRGARRNNRKKKRSISPEI